MKIAVMVALAVGGVRAGAAGGVAPERKVPVCMDSSVSAPAALARMKASKMFEEIGVSIEWLPDGCFRQMASGAIRISLSSDTPESRFRNALAYSLPYEGAHIVVFYDRVQHMVSPDMMPYLLAHVLVHEITHILEGTDWHSERGVMKARWNAGDYVNMCPRHLAFTEMDVILIHRGLDHRLRSP